MDIKSWLKYVPFVLIIILLGFISFYQWRAATNAKELARINSDKLMEANLELGRAHTKFAEQEKIQLQAIQEIDKQWKAEIKEREALVTLYAKLEGEYQVEKKKVKIVTKIIYKDNVVNTSTTVDLPKGKIFIRKDDGEYREVTSMPIAYSDFRLSLTADAIEQVLSYKLKQQFHIKFIETALPQGGFNHYFELVEMNGKEKVGQLEVTSFEVLKAKPPGKHMMWWNPKIDIGFSGGVTFNLLPEYYCDLGISLSSYGLTPNDLTWRFFRFSVGYTFQKGLGLGFSPVQYNIGGPIPLVSNMWITPIIGYDPITKGAFSTLGLSVVF